MENRYEFFKRLYKKYVIVFLIDGHYKSMGFDRSLIKYLKNEDISYVLVDSRFNVKVVDVINNKYEEYLLREIFYKLIRDAKKKEMIKKIEDCVFEEVEYNSVTIEKLIDNQKHDTNC